MQIDKSQKSERMPVNVADLSNFKDDRWKLFTMGPKGNHKYRMCMHTSLFGRF